MTTSKNLLLRTVPRYRHESDYRLDIEPLAAIFRGSLTSNKGRYGHSAERIGRTLRRPIDGRCGYRGIRHCSFGCRRSGAHHFPVQSQASVASGADQRRSAHPVVRRRCIDWRGLSAVRASSPAIPTLILRVSRSCSRRNAASLRRRAFTEPQWSIHLPRLRRARASVRMW